MYGWDWTIGGGLIMGLGMLLVWIIPIGLIVALVVYLVNQNKSTKATERAIDILERAYAKGEISREEFLQKRSDLLGEKKSE